MNNKHYSILLLLGVLFCTSSCSFEDDWDNPSNWYGSWQAQYGNRFGIEGIDIDKNTATVYFDEGHYKSMDNIEYFGSSSNTVKYKRGVKKLDNGCIFVSFTFDSPLFIYEIDIRKPIVGVNKVYVTTPINDHGNYDFDMYDDNQDQYLLFFHRHE